MKLFPMLLCIAFVLSVTPLLSGRILAADKNEILFCGEKVHGLKGFAYKLYKDRQDVRGIGMLMATAEFEHQLDYDYRNELYGKGNDVNVEHIWRGYEYTLATYTFTADRVRES